MVTDTTLGNQSATPVDAINTDIALPHCIDGLASIQKELLNITMIALPGDTEVLEKVKNLSNTEESSQATLDNCPGSSTTRKSSGKGKSQRKKKRCQFTWANKRARGDCIATKFDRVLVNESWIDQFPASIAMFLPSSISDHSLVVVTVSSKAPSFKKPFNFFDFWAKHKEFLPKVAQDWNQYIIGVPMFRVFQKLRSLKPILKSLNKKDFSDISTRVLATKTELDSIQWN
ncbi:hypothetical protein ACSBR2_039782 [Camellia fascicularis]